MQMKRWQLSVNRLNKTVYVYLIQMKEQSNKFNFTQRMTDLLSGSVGGKYRKPYFFVSMGWTAIPSIKSFTYIPNEYDPRWTTIGLKIRKKGKIEAEIMDRKLNKYLEYQVKRLEVLRKDPEKYFVIARKLMLKSITFRMSALRKIEENWWYKMSTEQVRFYHNKVTKIILDSTDELYGFVLPKKFTKLNVLTHRRVYIPKGDTFRPLGVPTIPWRICLHMLNNFLFQFMRSYLLSSQHGFIKGRGTLTAWAEVFQKVIQHKYIWECDLAQFFPSVSHLALINPLLRMDVPEWVINWIDNLNCSTPILPKKHLLDESLVIQKKKDVEILEQRKRMFNFTTGLGVSFGVPQGAPTSPLLSITSLRHFLLQVPSVSYADDPIFYNNEDFKIRGMKKYGIVIHPGKSGWVKREGQWLKKLTYLGLTYDPYRQILYKKSKSDLPSITLSIKDVIRLLEAFKCKGIDYRHKENNWYLLFKYNLFGVLMARLYEDSWLAGSYEIEPPKIRPGSWNWHMKIFRPGNPIASSMAHRDYETIISYSRLPRYIFNGIRYIPK